MTRSLLPTLTMLGASALTLAGCGLDATESGEQDVEPLERYLEELKDPRAITDDVYGARLEAELSELPPSEQALLATAIDRDAATPQQDGTVTLALTASIPVRWSWWPNGRLPSYVGTTTQCGGDTDVRVYWSSVANAYSRPTGLVIETNSVYVYGIMKLHGYRALAYDISSQNQVNVCVGLGPAPSTPLISSSVKGMFWAGMFIK